MAGSVLGLTGGLIGGVALAQTLMMPTALLLAAMFSTSIYFSFQACFLDETQTQEPDPLPRSD